jgi:Flp pilus assembly protein TadG
MKSRKITPRDGSISLEFLLILPVALMLTLAMAEFSLIFVARQQLTAASREGARVAAIGGSAQDVSDAVSTYLGTGVLGNAQVTSVLTDANNNPLPSGAPVQVVVTLPTAQAVPDFLAPFGFTVTNDVIIAGTIMRKE